MKIVNAKDCDIKQNVTEVTDALKKEPVKKETKNITMEEAMGISQEEEPAATTELSQSTIDMMKKELEGIEKSEDSFVNFAKMMEIARRLSRGDKVPATDEKKLMEFDAEMYHSAKLQGMMAKNKDRKKHDSLFEDEKKKELKDQLNQLKTENLGATPVQDAGIQVEAASSSGEAASAGEASVE